MRETYERKSIKSRANSLFDVALLREVNRKIQQTKTDWKKLKSDLFQRC